MWTMTELDHHHGRGNTRRNMSDVHDEPCCISLLKYPGRKKKVIHGLLMCCPEVCRLRLGGCVNLKVNKWILFVK